MCTADNHGYDDSNVLRIAEALLGEPCDIGYYDVFNVTGPRAIKYPTHWMCTQWKAIPSQIRCDFAPIQETMRLFCPCVSGKDLPVFCHALYQVHALEMLLFCNFNLLDICKY